ncbi:signal transduction histidine kinase [Salinibacter ruber]|uniref:GAF domain-containing sensor histidine kinase n=1 Tax=Salinibacter ruber TaxID=146919 RepID=UPI002167C189|nr:ATP-binding protein [Salinibacter ruber]MCS3628860.1 signal transduction histidine kinase [Salinibacter ruber]MCS3827188.1 signal transduction histidine kinase [Salinibacter ruber]MCS4145769.1 signal transduction histidine kinase [Salinibacter ruber]
MIPRPVLWGLLAVGLLPHWSGVCSADAAPTDSLQYGAPAPIAQVRRDVDGDSIPDRVGDTVVVAGRVAAAPGALPLPEEGVGSLQDGTGGIHVRLPDARALSRGDSARVWGVLRHEAGLAQIAGIGYERVEAARRTPDPVPLSVPSAASDRHEGQLARVDGTITARSANRGGEYFVLREDESSDAQLTVFVSNQHTERIRLGRFDEGDRVEVTGIISQYDLSYQVLPRGEDDLVHIGQAWTYLRWALLGVGGLGLVSIAVILFLRSAVRRRTQELTRREAELKDRQMKVEALYSATDHLLRAASRTEVAGALIDLVREVLGYRGVSVRFAEDGALKAFDVSETTLTFMPERPDFNIEGDSAVAEVYRSGTTLAVEDVEEMEMDDPAAHGDLRSVVVVPIGEHGTFAVASPEPGAISGFDTHLIEVLGSYATATLDRLDREKALRAAKEEAERARTEAEVARDQAEEAARLKSAFLANMSHEIRTPLTSIIGFAEALGDEVCDGNGNTGRFAGLIERSGRRLLDTLDGVLNLSKLEAGQMGLETEPVDLVTKARRAAEELRPQATEKGLGLTVETSRPEVWARADAGSVQIVLQNLVSNAIKYTEEGGVHVRVFRENGWAVLEVEDTGIGMDPALADDLFKPFRQASEGLGRAYEGSGVGLAVTQKATEEMGGQVDVETEAGAGSCFTVRLPEATSPEAEVAGGGKTESIGEA